MEHERGAFKVNREMRPRPGRNGANRIGFRLNRALFRTLQRKKLTDEILASVSYLLMD
jgi:hypothetical protein